MVKSYNLSLAAISQIEAISLIPHETFGARQTEAYIAGLESSFDLLVKFPGIGAAAFEVKPELRRYRYQSHYIFYTEHGDFIGIEAVIHASRSIRPDLFDI